MTKLYVETVSILPNNVNLFAYSLISTLVVLGTIYALDAQRCLSLYIGENHEYDNDQIF